ncbi:MAG: hypothetical protein ACLGH5_09900, partial [Actinomycetes bacterium]
SDSMSLDSVRAWLAEHAPDLPLIETEKSTATVNEAAQALGVEPAQIAKTLAVRDGAETFLLQDEEGQVSESWSVSAGLDYPAVGPEHAWLRETGRASYVGATDAEALAAFSALARAEGIICALESAHAVAHALKMADAADGEPILLVNLSGRGDKDLATASGLLGEPA